MTTAEVRAERFDIIVASLRAGELGMRGEPGPLCCRDLLGGSMGWGQEARRLLVSVERALMAMVILASCEYSGGKG